MKPNEEAHSMGEQNIPSWILFHTRQFFKYLTGLEEAQAGIKIARRNTNNLRYADDTTLTAESEEELKSLLMKVREESEKVGLKQQSKNEDHGIQSHYFMANRW